MVGEALFVPVLEQERKLLEIRVNLAVGLHELRVEDFKNLVNAQINVHLVLSVESLQQYHSLCVENLDVTWILATTLESSRAQQRLDFLEDEGWVDLVLFDDFRLQDKRHI